MDVEKAQRIASSLSGRISDEEREALKTLLVARADTAFQCGRIYERWEEEEMAKRATTKKAAPADLEALRQAEIAGCKAVISAPRVLVSLESKRLADQQLQMWENDDGTILARLASYQPRFTEDPTPLGSPANFTAEQAAYSMQQRASLAALQGGYFPCQLCVENVSKAILSLPLLPPVAVTLPTEDTVPNGNN